MKRIALLSFFLLAISCVFAQEKFTLSGYVKDANDGEDLYGANVYEKESFKGVSTNFYGFYSLTLPAGTYTIKYSSLGYDIIEKTVVLNKNISLNVEMGKGVEEIEAVVVTGKKRDANVDQVQTGTVEIETKTVKEIPALLGEPDVIKTLQLMPGVQGSSEGAGLIVRGSSPDQNLVLLDQATVYNTGHLLDFFSVFNNDAIKDIKLIKGGIPAEYGGRLSSVLDMKMKEGNLKKFRVSGGLGLISARLTGEGPIVKDKASFMASGRISYLGLIATPILKKSKDEQLQNASIPWFFDFNAKLNWKIGKKDRIFASGYFGRDYFAFGSGDNFSVDLPYGNATASFRWNHLFSGKLFMNNTFVFNQYDSKLVAKFQGIGFKYNSGITNYGLKGSLDYYPNDNHVVKIGYDYTFHEFTPGISTFDTGTDELDSDVQKKYGHELGVFIQDETDIGSRVKINYGVRFSMFSNTGPYDRNYYTPEGNIDSTVTKGAFENYATYFGAEPRVNIRVKILEDLSFKAGFNYINQYIHKVSQSTTTLPTEIWVPSSNIVKPETGLQVTGGFFKNWWDNKIETSIEGYYKKLWNQIEYGENPVPANNAELEDQFTFGTGESYGAEFFVKLKLEKLTAWVSYTLSKTTRDFKEVNNGNVFPHKYDKTHDLSVVLMYKPHKKWKLSGTFVYGSGQNTTIPVNYYFLDGKFNPVYGDRNSYRMPAYHRMDVGVTFVMLDKKNKYSDLSLSIYNVYNRKNPYFIFNDVSGDVATGEPIEVTTTQVSLFPILPTISWNFKY
ncbi:MAG: TonB-dependent receptor [Chitinophagales bacterium]